MKHHVRPWLNVRLAIVAAALVALVSLSSGAFNLTKNEAQAQGQGPTIEGPFVGERVKAGVMTKDLRTLPVEPRGRGRAREAPLGVTGASQGAPGLSAAETAQGQADANAIAAESSPSPSLSGAAPDGVTPAEFSTPSPNFPGAGYTVVVPPDTNGDVGPNHYIQIINSVFQIFNKSGTSLAGPSAISSLWTAAGDTGTCSQRNDGDPVVLYDHLADRWLISQFALPNGLFNAPSFECIAISRTANPVTGGWYVYTFRMNGANDRFDYPKLGVWPDAYYMSSQRGFPGNSSNPALDAWAFDRANMLNGNPATLQRFTINGPALILLPSDLDGPPPPAGTPNFFARAIDGNQWGGTDRVEVYAFHVDWGVPANSTFTALPSLATAAFDSNLCASGSLGDTCVPQPNTTQTLDTIPHWAMGPLQYRNFGSYETMVFNHTVDVDGNGHAGVRWYEFRRPTAGAWSINQQGTHSPDAGNPGLGDDEHRWMGSIAMDKAGDMALGYSASSGTVFPSVRYVGRLASDPPGLMPQGGPPNGEFTLVNGGNSQIANGNRWGDYSAMRVDPVDGCTFWYTQEYILAGEPFGAGQGGAWATRIGAFRFPTCNPADLSITKTASPSPAVAGQELFYTITVTNNGPDNATNVAVTDTLPAGVSFITDTDTCTEGPAGTLTCQLGNLASGQSTTFTIKVAVDPNLVASAGGPTTITNTASVKGTQADPNPADNTATASTIVEDLSDLKVTKLCKPDGQLLAGQTATCTIYVDNLGPSAARNVKLTDTNLSVGAFTIGTVTTSQGSCTTSGGVVTCNLGNLAAASPSVPGRATVTIDLTANEATDINDVATVVSDTPDPDTSNNQAQGSVSVTAVADLGVAKSAPASVVAGTPISWTVSVSNAGPSTATNAVIEDIVPAGAAITSVSAASGSCTAGVPGDPFQPTTCGFDSLAPGASRTMTINATVLPDTTGILHNDARVFSATFDSNNANDLAHSDTAVQIQADVTVSKAATPNPVVAGTALSHQITVGNAGPSTATGLVLTDPLPSSLTLTSTSVSGGTGSCGLLTNTNTVQCQLGSLDPGQNIVVYIYTGVSPSAPDGSTIVNTATVAAATPDPSGGNNSSTVTTNVIARADLGITLTSDKDVYKPSTVIHYTITVVNAGPSDAQNVVVTQVLPPPKTGFYVSNNAGCPAPSGGVFTCALGTIPAGGVKTFQLNFLVRGNKGTISQTATVSSSPLPPPSSIDPNPVNNSSTRIVTVK